VEHVKASSIRGLCCERIQEITQTHDASRGGYMVLFDAIYMKNRVAALK
jgi:hypothetical protein